MTIFAANSPIAAPAAPIQVGDVILRAKQRADIEKSGSSGVISDGEALNLCKQGARMLDGLINKTYEYYTMEYFNFKTKVDQLRYALPSNFHKLIGIGLVDKQGPSPNAWTPIYHWDMNNQNSAGTGFLNFTNGVYTFMKYRIAGPYLELRPVKTQQFVGIYYTPQAPNFLTTSDYLPAYYQPGWEEYIVNWMALMIAAKRQMANDVAMEMWKEIKEQIASFVPNRDSANPELVQKTWMRPSMWPGIQGGPFGGYGSW